MGIYQTVLSIYPSVAFSLLMIFAGLPTTIEWLGTSKFTKVKGAIKTSDPIVIFPTITALVPIQQLSPIFGTPALFPRFSCPIVTPVAILLFFPIPCY